MFFNDEKALIVFFLSYYFGVHQVIVSFKKDKNFLWGVLRTSNAWRIFEVFTLFYFPHISKNCFRIKLYLKQTLPLMSSWPPPPREVCRRSNPPRDSAKELSTSHELPRGGHPSVCEQS